MELPGQRVSVRGLSICVKEGLRDGKKGGKGERGCWRGVRDPKMNVGWRKGAWVMS